MLEVEPNLAALLEAGEAERVRALLAADPGLLARATASGESPVLLAVYHGKRDVLQVLLDQRPELTVFEAAAVGDLPRLQALTEEDPERLSGFASDGWTPLHLAAFFGHGDAVRWLAERGAELNVPARNGMGVTPLCSALASRSDECAGLLIDLGADVTRQGTGAAWAPLHYAAAHGTTGMARLLLDRGADPAARNADGVTPADMAAEKGHSDLSTLLRDAVAG